MVEVITTKSLSTSSLVKDVISAWRKTSPYSLLPRKPPHCAWGEKRTCRDCIHVENISQCPRSESISSSGLELRKMRQRKAFGCGSWRPMPGPKALVLLYCASRPPQPRLVASTPTQLAVLTWPSALAFCCILHLAPTHVTPAQLTPTRLTPHSNSTRTNSSSHSLTDSRTHARTHARPDLT